MTVREVVNLMPDMKEYRLATDGMAYDFNPKCDLHMAAFGDFDVNNVKPGYGDAVVEIELSRKFVKNGMPV